MDAIVCDTSAQVRLRLAQALDCMKLVFDQIIIPFEVWDECPSELQDELRSLGLKQATPVPDLIQKYGRGERAMLSLAIQNKIPYVLTDDTKAIKEAKRRNIIPMTSLAMLNFAKQFGYPITLHVAIARIEAGGDYIDEQSKRDAIAVAGEQSA